LISFIHYSIVKVLPAKGHTPPLCRKSIYTGRIRNRRTMHFHVHGCCSLERR